MERKGHSVKQRPSAKLSKVFFFLADSRTVTATASTKEKLDWISSIPNGATHAVNYKTQDFSKAITGGKSADVIVDPIGQSHWHKNIDSLAVDGRMILLAFLSGGSSQFQEIDIQNGVRAFQDTLFPRSTSHRS